MFEIVAYLIETLFADDILSVRTETTAVDDGFNEFVGGGTEVSARGDAANAFEAESIPDTAGGDVGFIDKIED